MRRGLVLPTKLILQQLDKVETVRPSGIIAPVQVTKNDTLSGKVILTGSACETIKEGMIVLYPRLSATKFNVDDDSTDYFLLPESSVLFAYSE
jgi:co-chaperonin GroES (HSP10)